MTAAAIAAVRTTHDAPLRALVRQHVSGADVRLVEEMGVGHGHAVVDVAAISLTGLAGFELKSERDSLTRLPKQVERFSAVFDQMTLVVALAHFQRAQTLVPPWWGLWMVHCGDRRACREPKPNPGPVIEGQLALLWRDELLEVARTFGVRRVSRFSVPALAKRLLEAVPVVDLKAVVLSTLRVREGWDERRELRRHDAARRKAADEDRERERLFNDLWRADEEKPADHVRPQTIEAGLVETFERNGDVHARLTDAGRVRLAELKAEIERGEM